MPLTDLCVTYNDVLAPGGYHRVTTPDRGRANINEHNDSPVQAYLWSSESSSAGAPITDIAVIDGGEEVPEGYEKIKRNLTKGAAGRKYLCVRRGDAEAAVPVSAVCIVYGADNPADADLEAAGAGKPLADGATPVRLFLKRSTGEGAGWTGQELQLQDWVDALDTENAWRVAQVIDATEATVTIHYKNWGSKWDDTVPRTSAKLAPVGTHTSGKDTGWKKRTVGGVWAVTPEEIGAFKERIRVAHEARKRDAGNAATAAFWVVDLPNFVEGCMTSKFEDSAVLPLIMDLLRFVVDVIVENVADVSRPVMPEILQQLHRVTGVDQHCSYFYNWYSRGVVESIAEYLDEPQDYVVGQRHHTNLKILVSMMNYMGRRRGFEVILTRIGMCESGAATPVCSLTELEAYIKAIAYLRMLYAKPFIKTYFKTFHEVVLARLSNVSDDELKTIAPESNDAIEGVVTQLELLLRDVRPDLNTEEIIEEFKMRMAKRFIVCPLLNYRIKGMSHLNEVLAAISTYEANKSNYMNLSRSALSRPLLTADWVADFLVEQQVPAIVLGDEAALKASAAPDTHIELMKRSTDMLVFLASQGRLTNDILGTLWNAAGQASQERTVLQILVGLMRKLSAEQLDLMDTTLREKLPRELTEVHVDLIRELAEASLGKIRTAQELSFGLDLLWGLLQDASAGAVSESLAAYILEAICDLTARDPSYVALSLLSTAALGNLRSGASVTTSVKALHRMLNCLPTSRATSTRGRTTAKSRERVLLEMHNDHKLLQLCIDEFKAFHDGGSVPATAKAGVARAPGRARAGALSPSNEEATAQQKLRDAVTTRLDFIAFIVQNCSVELAFAQILHLFNACTLDKLFPEETNFMLRWLADVAPHEGPSRSNSLGTMSRETLFNVFEQLLCKNDGSLRFEILSEDGYKCIERYFKLVNSCLRPGRLSIQADGCLSVEGSDLKGFDILWAILLQCTSDAVQTQVSEFIILLQLQLSPRLARRTVWQGFTDRCMRELETLEAGGGQPPLRVLRLLRTFLLEIQVPDVEVTAATKPNLASAPSLVLGPEETLLRAIVRCSGKKNYMNRECRLVVEARTTTVGQLRRRIAALMRYPPSKTRILNRRGEYLPVDRFDLTPLDHSGLMQYGLVDVDLRLEAGPDTAKYMHPPDGEVAENERLEPLRALANSEEHFNLLFRLLSAGPELMEEAWALIEMLPLHEGLVREVRTLDDSGSFLRPKATVDTASAPRVLYQLKAATETVEASLDPYLAGDSKAVADAWISTFVKKGGISYLLQLLTSSDVRSMATSSLGKNCLTALLKLTSLFAQGLERSGGARGGESPSGGAAGTGLGGEGVLESQADGENGTNAAGAAVASKPDTAEAAGVDMGYADEVRRVLVHDMGEKDILRLMERLLEVIHHVASTARPLVLSAAEKERVKEMRREEQRRRRFETFKTMAQNAAGKALEREASFLGSAEGDEAEDGSGGGGGGSSGDAKEPLPSEANVCRNAIDLLVAVARFHPRALLPLSALDVLSHAATFGILQNPERHIRRVVARGAVKMCDTSAASLGSEDRLAPRFAVLLCEALPSVKDHADHCREFFLTLCRLVRFPGALSELDVGGLCRSLREVIIRRPYCELTPEKEDYVLSGTAAFLKELLVAARRERIPGADQLCTDLGQADLVEELFERCLFGVPAAARAEIAEASALVADVADVSSGEAAEGEGDPPKAKHPNTRKACFELLAELARDGGLNLDAVVRKVQAHHSLAAVAPPAGGVAAGRGDSTEDDGDTGEDEDSDAGTPRNRASEALVRPGRTFMALPKSATGYVGLSNLGCICYLNSILQQLFMMPHFRRTILEFEPDEDDEEDDAENLIFQLQSLFAHLQDSEKAAFNPRPFTQAFKDWDNQPVDVLVQQDASEFYSNLLTKLESRLMGSDFENLLLETVQGTVSQELLAEGGKYRAREDVFYSIEVPVQNLRTLEEAMEKFIEGETVEYTWEEEETATDGTKSVKKVSLNTTKRLSLKKCPPHLVIHLKRFDFDYETFQQIKLNDYFEFPTELNVRAYTQDGRPDATPVAARRGSNAGSEGDEGAAVAAEAPVEEHPDAYYEYELAGVVIHMGTANSGHYYSYIKERSGRDKWFEFNDTYVGDFDEEDLAAECFGGEEEVSYMYGGYGGGAQAAAAAAAPNASRTYTRRKIQNAFMLIYDQKSARDARQRTRGASGVRERYPVPRRLADAIRKENEHYWRQKNILHPHYFAFMTDLLYRSGGQRSARQGTLACDFFFGTLYAAREREVLRAWESHIVEILSASSEARRGLLEQLAATPGYLADVYGTCYDPVVQSSVFEALAGALRHEAAHLAATHGAESHAFDALSLSAPDAAPEDLQPLLRFLRSWDGLLGTVVARPRRGRSLFRPLEALGLEWSALAAFLLRVGLLRKALVLYLGTPAMREFPSVRDTFAGFDLEADVAMDAPFRYRGLEDASLLPAIYALLQWHSLTSEAREYPHRPGKGLPPLTGLERDIVISPRFLGRLVVEPRTRGLQQRLTPLLWHIAFENETTSAVLVREVRKALAVQDDADLKKPFRALFALAALPDGQRAWRVRQLVYHTLEELYDALKYQKATECGLEMLFRLVKRDAYVNVLLRGDTHRLSFVLDYLDARLRNAYTASYPQQLYKVKRAGAYPAAPRLPFDARRLFAAFKTLMEAPVAVSSASRQRFAQVSEAPAVDEVAALDLEAEKVSFRDPGYDSDDEPEVLVGARVSVRWREGRCYAGQVTAYDAATHKHKVEYDDGDVREYVIHEKSWTFEETEGMRRPPLPTWEDLRAGKL